MENPILKIFNEMPTEELLQAVTELKEDSEKGIYREVGIVRKYAQKCKDITNEPTTRMLFLTEMILYKEAAYRWLKLYDVFGDVLKEG